jgi:hypothetical protein
MFTAAEVRAGSRALGLPQDHLLHAYALYCTEAEFASHCGRIGVRADYHALRAEMVPSPRRQRKYHEWNSEPDGPGSNGGGGWSSDNCGGGGDGGGD